MEVNAHLTEKAKQDYHLVDRALNGRDQQAYAELMNRYREPVYYMVLRMTGSPADAEDLTIEAFGKAFKNLENYSSKFAFSTWLFRIASNNCIDYLRKRSRSDIFDDDLGEISDYHKQNLLSQDSTPEEEMVRKELLRKIMVVVDKLKPHYRKLVELRYYKEYSYEEIAEQLELPLGTVKAQLFRAREFMQNLMGDRSL
jgi:RNA polymerase sigma-70 factor (ECF subfamily)